MKILAAVVASLVAWVFFGVGVASHTWAQAFRSRDSSKAGTAYSLTDYFERYKPIIVLRLLLCVVLFGIWWRNPEAVTNVLAGIAAKAATLGWAKLAIMARYVHLTPRDPFVALGFGCIVDGLLYILARYVPGFKYVAPEVPDGVVDNIDQAKGKGVGE